VLGNALYTVSHTRPGGTRQDVLAVRWGQEPVFRLNTDACDWLAATTRRPSIQARLVQVRPWETDLTETDLTEALTTAGLTLSAQQRQQVWDALAMAAYHAQTVVPIVRHLLSDDAAAYQLITDDHALCWVHDGRHYAKRTPVVPHHQAVLAAFRQDYWAYYHRLVAYRVAPTPAARDQLRTDFATLVAQRTGYQALDERIAKTAHNAELLLLVLDHPEIPLHNNDME
jgi:hypothetical protein